MPYLEFGRYDRAHIDSAPIVAPHEMTWSSYDYWKGNHSESIKEKETAATKEFNKK